jgi:hypothetical protein
MGQRAGDQLEEQHSQGVDVGRRGDRLAQDLLRRGIGGGEHAGVELGEPGRLLLPIAIPIAIAGQQLGDAEVEQLDLARRGHQDVGRLEVAVHHQAAVGAVDRRADALHQPQPRLQAEPLAILGDRRPLHPVEHEERPAVGGAAAVEQAGDAGVVEPGEDLALAHEAPDDRLRVHAPPDQLERRPLDEGPLVALREIDLAHAATAEQAEQAPGADPGAGGQAGLGGLLLSVLLDQQLRHGMVEEVRRLAVRLQQPRQAGGERRVLRLQPGEAAGAGRRRQLGQLIEQLLPAGRRPLWIGNRIGHRIGNHRQ